MLLKANKTTVLVLIVLALLILNNGLVFADDLGDDPLSGGLPDINKLYGSGDLSKYMTKYKSNYSLDMVEFKIHKEPMGLINGAAQFLFICQIGIAHLLIVIFYYSFELDFFELFRELVETLIGEMRIAVFDELVLLAIVLIGVFYIINILKNHKTQIWISIMQIVVIIAISYAFFSNPAGFFQGVDGLSKEISQKVLTGTYRANNKGTPESAVTAAANEIWNMFVHRPWQILEFGSEQTAEKYQDEILSMHPDSKERSDFVKELSEERGLFTTGWGIKRLGFMVMYFIPLAVQFVGMIILCLLMLGYQALLIILALVGVFVLLMALIPFFGWRVLGNWAGKIFSCAATKVAITFVLALLVAFNSALFKLADQYGWLLVLIFQLVIILVGIWKRQMFFDIFTVIRLAPQGSLQKNRFSNDYNIERKMFERSKNMELRKTRNRELSSIYQHYEDDESERKEKYEGRSIYVAPIPSLETTVSGSTNDIGGYTMKSSEILIPQNESYNRIMKLAEEVLEKQYEIAKETAEKKAEEIDVEVKYPYFVQQVMTRESLGAQKFDDREIAFTMEKVREIINSGGNIRELYKAEELEKDTSNETDRPQSVIQIYMDGQQYQTENKGLEKISIEDASIELTQEFNQTYKRNFDKEFMKSLIEQYGHSQVRFILDRMKEIERKNESIKNPAGYLTQSLKNNQRDNVNEASMRGRKNEEE